MSPAPPRGRHPAAPAQRLLQPKSEPAPGRFRGGQLRRDARACAAHHSKLAGGSVSMTAQWVLIGAHSLPPVWTRFRTPPALLNRRLGAGLRGDRRLLGGERCERAGHPLRPAPPAAGAVEGHHRAARPLPARRGSRPSRRRRPQASPAAQRSPRWLQKMPAKRLPLRGAAIFFDGSEGGSLYGDVLHRVPVRPANNLAVQPTFPFVPRHR